MATELARRGDLVLLRSETGAAAGLYRGEGDELRPAGKLDAGEWHWVLVCAAPLAVRSCPRVDEPGVELDEELLKADGVPVQDALPLDAGVA